MRAWLAGWLSLLLLAPAAAQDAAPAPLLQAPLRQAASGDALQRLLGERFFRDPGGGLVVARAQRDEQAGLLRCEVDFLALGGMRVEETRLTSAVELSSGRVVSVGASVVRGRRRLEAEGTIQDGKLEIALTVQEGEQPAETHRTQGAWEPDRLPWALAVFFLPLLHDQGLPAAFDFRVYHEAIQRLDGGTAHWRLQRDPQGLQVELADVFPDDPPVRVLLDPDGGVDLGRAGRLTPIDAAEGQRLLRAARR